MKLSIDTGISYKSSMLISGFVSLASSKEISKKSSSTSSTTLFWLNNLISPVTGLTLARANALSSFEV